MYRTLPALAAILGVAGLLPFVVLGLASIGADSGRALAATQMLIAYGAVVLSFIGAVHWGFTLGREDDEDPATRHRLIWGAMSPLVGFAALVLAQWGFLVFALAALIAGYVLALVAEMRAHQLEWMPPGYMTMRWPLTIAVVAVLTTVLVLRGLGAHILL
jgi:hypothetical protein